MECAVELPPVPERVQLTAVVAWTHLRSTEHTSDGDRQIFQSGMAFSRTTPDQQAALARVLERLKAEREK